MKTLGVLMLETRFERILGDIGNPDSFDFPVVHREVRGANPTRVVHDQDEGLVELFAAAAMDLVDDGVTAITTSCGFLAKFQDPLAARIPVPFAASALHYLTTLVDGGTSIGSRPRVGVITADARTLRADVLPPNGIAPEAILGLEDSPAFRSAIINQTTHLDAAAIEREVTGVAQLLVDKHPDLDAVILECTNLPPYRSALTSVLAVPIYDSLTLADDLMNG